MQITWLKDIDSTNNEATRNMADAPEGKVWAAQYQTAGRGQQNTHWESEAGKNFLFSLLLRPTWLPPEDQFYISKIASLGICDYLAAHAIDSAIKWPNDGYAGNRKIAGMLIEHHIGGTLKASIIGIGLNANQAVFSTNAANPTSVLLETGHTVAIEQEIPILVNYILMRYDMLRQGDMQLIDAHYLSRLYWWNEWHWFEKNGQRFQAKIIAISRHGQLITQDEKNKNTAFSFKEISFVS